MSKALVLLAPGFEEVEAVSIIDILRRGDITVDMASITDDLYVTGSHQITIRADLLLRTIEEVSAYDAVITPGGQPGSTNLSKDDTVLKLLRDAVARDKLVASICASPMVLEAAGLTAGKIGTSFPGIKEQLSFSVYREDLVVRDGNLITSRGPGTAIFFALAIIKELAGQASYDKVREALLIPQLREQIQEY